MKNSHSFLLCLGLLLASCGQKSDENKVLYDEVMGIHNEVMPKMDEIYKVKEALKAKIAADSTMAEDKKSELEAAILKLDSAGEGMMIWMRKFTPLPDTASHDAAKTYLESEKVKVEKVRSDILNAIEKGNALK